MNESKITLSPGGWYDAGPWATLRAHIFVTGNVRSSIKVGGSHYADLYGVHGWLMRLK